MRWVAWMIALMGGGILWAQSQVVNLRYELWWDERSFWYGQRLEPTAPGDARLPPLSDPRFFIGKFVDGERLFVLATQDGQPVLYPDTDGDKDLTDEQPFRLRQRGWDRVFGPVPMRFRINGRTVIQHFGVTMDREEKQVRLSLLIASRWTGTLMLNGKPTLVTVVDDNTDGAIGSDDTVLLDEGRKCRLPVAGRIMLNGQFCRFQVAPTGEHLTLEPIDAPKGQIRFNGERASITLESNDGAWILEGQNGTMPAPVGDFRIIKVEITRKDKEGRFWTLSAHSFGPAAPKVRVTEESTPLNLEPLKISLVWNRKGSEFEFSLDIKTANGMRVNNLMVNNRRPPEPKLRLTAPNGKVVSEPKFHYG